MDLIPIFIEKLHFQQNLLISQDILKYWLLTIRLIFDI
jgi:hypothetical protein